MRASNLLDRAISYNMQPVSGPGAMYGGFKSVDEKYRKTKEAYTEVTGTYRGTQSARLAGMGEADALFWLKEYDKALAAFQDLLGQHRNDFWTPTLQERIANCQESLNRWQEALNTYQSLLAQTPDYYNRRAVRLGTARCQYHLGKAEDAARLLEEEQKAEPGSFWSEQARLQLALYGQNSR